MITSNDLTFGVGDYIISPHVGIHKVLEIEKQYVTPQAKQLFSTRLADLEVGDEMCPIVIYQTSFTPTGQSVPYSGIKLSAMASVCVRFTTDHIDCIVENLDNLRTIIVSDTRV